MNKLGADYIATGIMRSTQTDKSFQLLKGEDGSKDQATPVSLNQTQLAGRFPIGHLYKREVRIIAKEANLPNSSKKDSTSICFIGESVSRIPQSLFTA